MTWSQHEEELQKRVTTTKKTKNYYRIPQALLVVFTNALGQTSWDLCVDIFPL